MLLLFLSLLPFLSGLRSCFVLWNGSLDSFWSSSTSFTKGTKDAIFLCSTVWLIQMKAKVEKSNTGAAFTNFSPRWKYMFHDFVLFFLLNNRGRLKGMFSFFTFLSIFFPSLCRLLSGSASFCPSLKFLKISSAQVSTLVQEQQTMTQLRPGQVFCIKSWHLALVRHSSLWGNSSPLPPPPQPPTPQPSPPRLTVAWKNNCTRKTIKTILAEIPQDGLPNLLASSHGLRCGGIWHVGKISRSLPFIGAEKVSV